MGGIAPPKPPRCYNILSFSTAAAQLEADSENITKSGFAIKADENLFASAVETNECCPNENSIGVKSNYRLAKGCSLLMYACQQGLTDTVVHELRTKPERIRQRDNSNKSVLHYCSGQRDLVAAASVAVAAPDLLESADEDGFTPLHLAVIQGNLAMVNLLLANKADVNAVDNEGHSVVHWATVCGEVEALRSVLQAGANVKTPDINGGSPLHYAAQMCGANYESKLGTATSSKLALEILDVLLAHPQSSVDITDKDGRKPLLWAASAGSAKAITALVKAGSRVESADKDGLTALHCAASRGHTECIDTLISLCGAPTDLIDSNGCTALHYAVTLGHADATSRLLDLDADPNRQDRKGRTPAHCGCSKGQFETVKLLKEWGANLWLRNAKGDLPLHEAALSGRIELVEWLLEQKPKQVNTTSNDGRSLLHIAASNDYTDICKLLLDYGANVNSILRNSKGVAITPLDCALQKGFRSTAKFIQSNGGLPASKLRLSARRLNAFNDQDLVKPLKYAEKEEHNSRDSKKCVVYSKRSDSDSGGRCSCNEHTYKKEHTYSHTCRHHRKRFRRRTSSCGEAKNACREDSCSDICRSKSNIEIRRRKSRERISTSDSDLNSCENCCYHKKKHRLKRKGRIIRRVRDPLDDYENFDGKTDEKIRVKTMMPSAFSDDKFTFEPQDHTSSRTTSKAVNESILPSADQQQTGESIKNMLITLPLGQSLTDEDCESMERVQQVVVTQADIHAAADAMDHVPEVQETVEEKVVETVLDSAMPTTILSDGNLEEISNEVNQVLDSAATVVKTAVTDNLEKPETILSDGIELQQDDILIERVENSSALQTNESSQQTAAEVDSPDKAQIDESTPDEKPKVEERNITEINKEEEFKEGEEKEHTDDRQAVPSNNLNNIQNNNIPLIQEKSELDNLGAGEILQQLASDGGGNNLEEGVLPSESTIKEEDKLPVVESVAQEEKVIINEEDSFPNIEVPIAAEMMQPSGSTQTNKQKEPIETSQPVQPPQAIQPKQSIPSSPTSPNGTSQNIRDQETRRSFTLLPDSPDDLEAQSRKSSFQILKSDESVDVDDVMEQLGPTDMRTFQIISDEQIKSDLNAEISSDGDGEVIEDEKMIDIDNRSINTQRMFTSHSAAANGYREHTNGRKRRLKKRIKSGGARGRSYLRVASKAASIHAQQQHASKDQDSGFEPSPRAVHTKIPTPRTTYTAHVPRKAIYATLDGRLCSSRLENRKPGDKGACDMSAVTRSIQRNIRRYYMERKIFQHLLELKGLQIRSNKLNEAVLVKRAVDEYHKSCVSLGGETGTTLRRYSYSEYTFKNFELFLYETLKTLQRPGTFNFQNINDVYEEAERRLSPDYNAYEKALQCTTKTHRCLHAAHAYTGIPCASYIPMMNHHTMPKFGFGPYKKNGAGSFYLPRILSSNPSCGSKVSLELSHGKNKQLISLPSEKLDSNKRYYVTFTVKESGGKQQLHEHPQQQPQTTANNNSHEDAGCSEKPYDQKKSKQDKDDK